MRKMILILVTLVALTNIVYAEFNGVDWKSMSNYPDRDIAKLYKTLPVRGIYEGVGYAGDIEFKKMFFIEPESEEGKGYFGNLVDELDRFYLDDRNINIIIPDALFIISCELKGEKAVYIKELKEVARKKGNNLPLRQEWLALDDVKKLQNTTATPAVKRYEDNSQFWRRLGQGLSDYSQQQDLERIREAESIQSNVQVIGTRPAYRINNGYVYPEDSDKSEYRINKGYMYPMDSDKSEYRINNGYVYPVDGDKPAYRVSGGYLYPSDDNIHILGNEKK